MQKKFSYPLKIDELNQNQYRFEINADQDELTDIAEILKVEEAEKFAAEIFLKRNIKEHSLKVWGTVNAQLMLQSVISLENFLQEYNVPFTLTYDTTATYQDIKEMETGINDEVPDIIENGEINLADIALEQIALNMEDYPRAKGEIFDFNQYLKQEETSKENPFAVLQKLKK